VKARAVKKLDRRGTLADNVERIVRVRADEVASFIPQALDPAEVQALHDMRIAAKRLRYILELTGFCFGAYAVEAASHAKDLQDLLGEIHDCDVTLPRVLALIEEQRDAAALELRRRASDARDLDPALVVGLPGADAWRGLEDLATFLRARRTLLFDRFVEHWDALQREGFIGRLRDAAAERPAVQVESDVDGAQTVHPPAIDVEPEVLAAAAQAPGAP
jgi:CHAD domain-containing protein